MAKYKEGVMISGVRITHGEPRKLIGPSPEIQIGITVWDGIIREENIPGEKEGTVTSLGDSVHTAKNSKHYGSWRTDLDEDGYYIEAVDFRTRYMNNNQKMSCADKLKKRLRPGFDVVIHSSHIHLEWDPK